MANSRYYSSTALQTTLTGGISNSNTTIDVVSTAGFPGSFPYTLAIDYGAAAEELVEATAGAGLSLTVTRAIDGTSAQSHSSGAVVRHVSSARDFTDSRTHEAATTDVHGVTGALVGATQTQTLTNKTLTSPTINSAAIGGTWTGAATFSGAITFSGALTLSGGGSLSGTWSGAPTFSGAVVFSGAPVFTDLTIGGVVSGQPTFGTIKATTVFKFTGSFTGTETIFASNPNAEAFDRYRIYGDGKQEWGDGAGARDTNLYRSAANTLKTDDALTVVGEIAAQNLVRGTRALSTDTQYETRVVADANARWFIRTTGEMNWGPGSGSTDTNLYRGAANQLKTDDDFVSNVAQSTSTTVFTIGSGWTLAAAQARVTAGVTTVSIVATRTGGTITADAAGNIADTQVGTLTSGFRPGGGLTTQWTYDKGGVADGSVSIGTDGICTIKTLSPTATINNTDNVSFTAIFI